MLRLPIGVENLFNSSLDMQISCMIRVCRTGFSTLTESI
jgi:hypothetical protein